MTTAGLSVQVPYLPTSRKFPRDPGELETTLSKTYIEIAQAVNRRTIGVYNKIQVVTGNQYFSDVNNNVQNPIQFRQSYRQTYEIATLPGPATNSIPGNIQNLNQVTFVNIYGVAQDRANFAVALTPWNMTRTDDALYLRFNFTNGNIEIITNTNNWAAYSAIVVLEYLLN